MTTQARGFVAKFSQNDASLTKRQVLHRLNVAGVVKRTSYHILKNLEVRGNVEHAGTGKSGPKAAQMNAQKKRLLLKAAEGRVRAPLRALTRRFGVNLVE